MNDADFMRMAIEAAWEGLKKGEMPFGACVVRKGQVLAVAHNSTRADLDATAHGEVQAIRAASRRVKTFELPGTVLYTTCEPCPMCFAACLWARVGRIVYACRIEDAAQAGIGQMPISSARMKQLARSDVQIAGDVLREDSRKLFEAWSRGQTRPGT